MNSLNKVQLIGNLGKDPEVRYFDSGAVKASFPIATSERYTNREGQKVENTDWHNVVMWRGIAQVAEKYLKKGSKVYIEGKIKTRSYDDQDGNKKYITEIEAQNLIMLDRRDEAGFSENNASTNMSSNTPPQVDSPKPAQPETVNNDLEDDLPF